MKNIHKYILVILTVCSSLNYAQVRAYEIHKRGMLWQTVFNTGELGRSWMTGSEGNTTTVPLMEWPSRSASVLNGTEYSGQHNSIGAGVLIAANLDSLPGQANRLFAHCGAVGASSPEMAFGRWSMPYYIDKKENFPILSDGSLNSGYDPDEAEEIIEASWATSVGIKVTRTSRAWSYPDYDDLIIYEYEFVYNGDIDGNEKTVEMTKKLKDVEFAFVYGLAPSMYGYQRNYNDWKYDAGMYKGDQDMYWDMDYWLTFNQDRMKALDWKFSGKPEPDSTLFRYNATTGANGGALLSPQAPGFCVMQYDTLHLTVFNPTDTTKNESEYKTILSAHKDSKGAYYELSGSNRLKQPWINRLQTGDVSSTKMETTELLATDRTTGYYTSSSAGTAAPGLTANSRWNKDYWRGRGKNQYGNTAMAVRKNINFGPYTMNLGDTVHITIAEVVGYGADANKAVEGGRDSATGKSSYQWNKVPSWYRAAYSYDKSHNIVKMTDNYLKDYGYPDYVNSNVRNVQQVAHKAYEAYLGLDSAGVYSKLPIHPDEMPVKGSYKIAMPCPAPVISLANTDTFTVRINWNRVAELFSSPRLTGVLTKYKVYRSTSGMGPWKLLDTVLVGTHLDSIGNYAFIDKDQSYQIGDYAYYAVTSIDDKGFESGKTNITYFKKSIAAVKKLNKVFVVPNPLLLKSGYGTGTDADRITFYELPAKCTIRIFSFAGNLVETIEHDAANDFSEDYFQVTRNGQSIASGIYFYVVSTPSGDKYSGKMLVIK
jgi:hypothetical protein